MMQKFNRTEFKTRVEELDFDYLFVSASFEQRSFIIPEIIKNLPTIIFYNNNESSIIKTNATILSTSLENKNIIELNTDDPIHNYLEIFNLINIIGSTNKPINILLDSTTFTHETLLILIRLINFNSEKINSVYISYVGAREYSTNESDDEKWLSKGIKEIRTVIGYPGFSDPTKKNHLIILFGFESERTKKIIDEYEFEYVSLGFANIKESIQVNHQKINCDRHTALVKEYKSDQFEFSLIDSNHVKQQLLDYINLQKFADMNTVIAPMNNKISTIGAGLAAIENPNIQITYAKPNIYNISGYSEPNDDIYFGLLDFNKV